MPGTRLNAAGVRAYASRRGFAREHLGLARRATRNGPRGSCARCRAFATAVTPEVVGACQAFATVLTLEVLGARAGRSRPTARTLNRASAEQILPLRLPVLLRHALESGLREEHPSPEHVGEKRVRL